MPGPLAITLSNGEVFYDPHPGRQTAALWWLTRRVANKRDAFAGNVFIYGNRGGGKSRLVRAFFHNCALTFPGLRYIVVRRHYPDLTKNHLIYLHQELLVLKAGKLLRADHQVNYSNGSVGFYSQCETAGDVDKVVGAEAALLFVDEAPQIAFELLRMMAPSLRVPINAPYRTLGILSGNPTGESIDDIWRYYVDKDVDPEIDPEYDPADFHSLELRLEDNPSLDPKEYRKQFAGLPEHIRKAWLDGERMQDRTLFTVIPRKNNQPYHYISDLPRIDGKRLVDVEWVQWVRAFDMGFYPDPAVALWIAIVGRRVIVVHERTWTNTIAKDLAAGILQETKDLLGRELPMVTYADPAIDIKTGHDAITVRDTLELNGVAIECSVNDRVLYADAIHGLLGEEVEPGVPRLQIYEPGCPNLCKYLPRMRWDETNPRKMANHSCDHWPITLAYFAISSGVLVTTAATETAVEPIWKSWVREAQAGRRRWRR